MSAMQLAKTLQRAESITTYINRLQSLGHNPKGAGRFCRVFPHPQHPDLVVKVFSTQDTGYMSWLEMCQLAPRNPWVPKVIEVHYPENSPEVGLAFIAKLRPAPPEKIAEFSSHVFDVLNTRGYSVIEFSEMWQLLVTKVNSATIAEIDPALVAIIKMLRPVASQFYLDIHQGNVMVDTRDRLVLSDPLAPKNWRSIPRLNVAC